MIQIIDYEFFYFKLLGVASDRRVRSHVRRALLAVEQASHVQAGTRIRRTSGGEENDEHDDDGR